MKRLGWLLAVLALFGSALWLAGAVASERLVASWLQARQAEGWSVARDSIDTTGFPAGFSTRIEALQLADPRGGWALVTPWLQLDQQVLHPGRITVTWPERHVFATGFEELTITAEHLTTTLAVDLLDNLALQQSDTRMQALAIDSSMGWSAGLDSGQLRFTRQGDSLDYQLQLDAAGVLPAAPLRALLDPSGQLPELLDRLHADAVIGFARAWDLSALEQARPAITRIELAQALAEWGDLAIRVSGALDVDAMGLPTGSLAIRAQNWRGILDLAENGGSISGHLRRTLESALAVLAGLNGEPEALDATLTFAEGQLYLGPVPLGPAPRIVLR